MSQTPSLAIILAAGKGTRMKSELPKVMHKLAGATLLAHVMKAARAAGIDRTAVVVGPGMEEVGAAASALDSKTEAFVQAKQLGTADAVKAARAAFEAFKGDERALTLCNSGIMAFRSAKTLLDLLGRIGNDNAKGEFYLTDAVALARGDRLEA